MASPHPLVKMGGVRQRNVPEMQGKLKQKNHKKQKKPHKQPET